MTCVRHTVSVDLLSRRVDGVWGRAGRRWSFFRFRGDSDRIGVDSDAVSVQSSGARAPRRRSSSCPWRWPRGPRRRRSASGCTRWASCPCACVAYGMYMYMYIVCACVHMRKTSVHLHAIEQTPSQRERRVDSVMNVVSRNANTGLGKTRCSMWWNACCAM